ncbi:MAG: DNA-processing protein DprA [Coriobacteriales bacterium]|nr:DNA-processing protein DprA [Coriobacteriales bacterium]
MPATARDSAVLRHEINLGQAGYPAGFLGVYRPPPTVYAVGDAAALMRPSLAIVGARKATPYGLACAKRFASRAAARGIVVVSGGAIGCDQAAHRGALAVGGQTVVVLGCGADVVYPTGAADLFAEVLAASGTIISEAPWGSPVARWCFRQRNRLIAGLAQATLIVEAGLPSGTFSTADDTLAQGKEVLAVPGSIYARESRGANRLIAQGAVPIVDDQSFDDALVQIFGVPLLPVPGSQRRAGLKEPLEEDDTTQLVRDALIQAPATAEGLVGICGADIVEVVRYLSLLELHGMVCRLRDGRYSLSLSELERSQ